MNFATSSSVAPTTRAPSSPGTGICEQQFAKKSGDGAAVDLTSLRPTAAAPLEQVGRHRAAQPRARDGWRLNARANRAIVLRRGDAQETVTVVREDDGFSLEIADRVSVARGTINARGALRYELDGVRALANVVDAGAIRHVFLRGRSWALELVEPVAFAGEGAGAHGGLVAPMPGRVIAILAEAGSRVEKGAPLMISGSYEDGAHNFGPGSRPRHRLPLFRRRSDIGRDGAVGFRAGRGVTQRRAHSRIPRRKPVWRAVRERIGASPREYRQRGGPLQLEFDL